MNIRRAKLHIYESSVYVNKNVVDSSGEGSPRMSQIEAGEGMTLPVISESVKESSQLYTFPSSEKNNGYTLAETRLINTNRTSIINVS